MDTIDGTPVTDKQSDQHEETKSVPSFQLDNWPERNETAEINMTRNDLVEHFKLKAFIENNITKHVNVLSDPERGIREYEDVTEWKRHGSPLGQGQMGAVHLEVQVGNPDKKRAVKVISKRDLREGRFDPQRELRFLGIASKYGSFFTRLDGWFETKEDYRIPMEHIEHGDLSRHIHDLEEWDAKVIGRQLLEALEVLRLENIAHHDLKPGNIFVVRKKPQWWLKIGDFGISQNVTVGGRSDSVLSGSTPGYESPEFLRGEKSMDPHAVDMWALGIILQHVLTGKEPGLATTQTSIFDLAEDSLQPNLLEEKKVSTEGIEFIRRLLLSDPSQRPGPKECLEDPWICEDRNNALRALDMAGLNPEERLRNPENAMLWAIENGNRDVIHLALDQDFDTDAVLVDGLTALHYSITTGNLDAVRYFVELGANLDQETELDMTETCLHLAVRWGQPEILKYLIEHDAAIEAVSASGKTPLATFESDISRGCLEVLLDHNANTESAPDIFPDSGNTLESELSPSNGTGNGYTPLHQAASLGLEKITRLLLTRGANIRARTKDGETSLHIATDKGHVSVVEVLLEFEAPIEAKDNYGNTALAISSDVALPTVELLLVRNANIGASNDEGFRPLHHTACSNCPAVADLFLRRNAVVDPKSKWGSTPLHLATASGASEVVRLLLKNKADIEALDEEGFTPLGCFSDASSSCVDLLLANGANIKVAKNLKKLTPLHLAAQAGNARVVELLLAKARRRSSDFILEYNEAKIEKKDAKKEWRNAKGFNESLKASSRLCRARSNYHKARAECDELLTEFSNTVNAKSSGSRTPLDYAAEGNSNIVEAILRDNMGHSGTYLGQVVRVAVKSLRKIYENWRTCEQCKSTIFASGWQCEICEPETRSLHDTRRTYDLCNGCVARGYRCSGEGHLMYAKSAAAPIDLKDAAPLLESPRLAFDNRPSPYQASSSSSIGRTSTISVNSLPQRNCSEGPPGQRRVHKPSGKLLRIGMEAGDGQLGIHKFRSNSPRVVSSLQNA